MAKIRCIQVTSRHHSSQKFNNDVKTSQNFVTLKTFKHRHLPCTSSTDTQFPVVVNVWRKQEESTSPLTILATSTSTHYSRSIDQNHYHQKIKMDI